MLFSVRLSMGGEAETERVAFTVFHFAHLGIVAEVVAAFHELVRLYGKSLLFAEAALGIEAFVLLVNASYNLPDDSLFLAQIIMEIGTLHGLFFGDARTETVLGKAYGQGVQAVVGTGTRRFGESLLQGGFKQHDDGFFGFISRHGARQG